MPEEKGPDPNLFWEVEDYLWTLGFSHPPKSEMREWYLSGWVELTNYRPSGPCPEYVMERARRRHPAEDFDAAIRASQSA